MEMAKTLAFFCNAIQMVAASPSIQIGPSIILIALLTYQLSKVKQLNALIGASMTLFVPVLFASIYFFNVYSIFVYHPVYQFNQIWSLSFWTNLLAMFSDRATGLLWHGPIWILGLAATIWMALQKKANVLAISILALIGSLVVFGLVMPDPRAEGSSFNRLLGSVIPLTVLGLAWLIEKVNEEHWLKKLMKLLVGWSVGSALLLTMLPDLTNEAVRLKLAEFLKIDFLYNYLPSFGDHSSMVHLLVAIIITLLIFYFIYKVVEQVTIINKHTEK